MALLPSSAAVEGQVIFRGQDMLQMTEADRRKLRGDRLALVFQDSLAALNPVFSVGYQIEEAIAVHHPRMSSATKRERAIDLLELVGVPNPAARVAKYPHTLTGGLRHIAMIASVIPYY